MFDSDIIFNTHSAKCHHHYDHTIWPWRRHDIIKNFNLPRDYDHHNCGIHHNHDDHLLIITIIILSTQAATIVNLVTIVSMFTTTMTIIITMVTVVSKLIRRPNLEFIAQLEPAGRLMVASFLIIFMTISLLIIFICLINAIIFFINVIVLNIVGITMSPSWSPFWWTMSSL